MSEPDDTLPIVVTAEMRRDFGRILSAAMGAPSPEKMLVMLDLALGSLLASGVDIDWLADYCEARLAYVAERLIANDPNILDGKRVR